MTKNCERCGAPLTRKRPMVISASGRLVCMEYRECLQRKRCGVLLAWSSAEEGTA